MVATTYTTHWPSGESCGSRTSRRRARSSSLNGRFAVCANRLAAKARMRSRMESLFLNMIRISSGPNQIELRSSEISNAKILRFVIFSGSSAVGKDSIHEIARSRVKRTVEIQHPRTRLGDLITCPYQCRKLELAL